MSKDGTDFHGFLPVLIGEIRVNPCPIFRLSGAERIRIISARKLTRAERKAYEEEIYERNG